MLCDIDHDIIELIASNWLDCSGLSEALKAGEENEMTVLYNIYLRQKQSQKMNCIFRMSDKNNLPSQEQTLLPLIQSEPRRLRHNLLPHQIQTCIRIQASFPAANLNDQSDPSMGQRRLRRPEVILTRTKRNHIIIPI
jgi:hypothetical protein